jgi:hypothetical protein
MVGKKPFGKRRKKSSKDGKPNSSWVGVPIDKRLDLAVRTVQEGWRSIQGAANDFKVPMGVNYQGF